MIQWVRLGSVKSIEKAIENTDIFDFIDSSIYDFNTSMLYSSLPKPPVDIGPQNCTTGCFNDDISDMALSANLFNFLV